MKIEFSTPSGESGEVVLDTHDGVPVLKIVIGDVATTRRLLHSEVNDLRRWTELAYPRGQER